MFDGGLSPADSSDEKEVEEFNIRPEADKWIFDGEDLDAPEPICKSSHVSCIVYCKNALTIASKNARLKILKLIQ